LSTLLANLLGCAAVVLLIPGAVLFIEVLLAVTACSVPVFREGNRKRVAVLMPAHNEAAGIATALRTLIPELREFDRLIVIADNCSDETAAIATTEGAEVILRTDAMFRGKGYALDFGVRHLQAAPPDVVVIIDADCRLEPGSLDQLAILCTQTMRPTQGLYLMHAGSGAPLRLRIAEFAWLLKNRVRPEGLNRLGLPCHLMGTGMAFPWSCISAADLATGHIAEDLKLGLDLARAGTPALFCPEALVTSHFPIGAEGVRAQRQRWEHGHLSLILREAPRLFLRSLTPPNAALMALALDLSVPPLALLVLMVAVLWCVTLVFWSLTSFFFPFGATSFGAILIVLSVLLSWRRYGRGIISLIDLGLAVIYPLSKIPLYIRFLLARQTEWIRSKRDEDQS
jgi:cellulose synthase/poly-beta-1,6-N-acetylglucosamine synthase-like glycosyltransferase